MISADNRIDLWLVQIADFIPVIPDSAAANRLLSEEEIQRANRFHFPAHRIRFIVAHRSLRQILSRYTDVPAEKLEFGKGPHHKPFLDFPAGALQFNLSHTDTHVLIAVTRSAALGVDIEAIRSDVDPGIPARFFTDSERILLEKLPESARIPAFFRLWTGKEAVLKMTGKGLLRAIGTFSIDPAKDVQTPVLPHQEVCHLYYPKNWQNGQRPLRLSG